MGLSRAFWQRDEVAMRRALGGCCLVEHCRSGDRRRLYQVSNSGAACPPSAALQWRWTMLSRRASPGRSLQTCPPSSFTFHAAEYWCGDTDAWKAVQIAIQVTMFQVFSKPLPTGGRGGGEALAGAAADSLGARLALCAGAGVFCDESCLLICAAGPLV